MRVAKTLRDSWEILSVVIAVIAVLALISIFFLRITNHGDSFRPLALDSISVRPTVIKQGGMADLIDGLCNKSDYSVSTQITLILEPDAGVLSPSVPLSDSMKSVDPHSCPAPAIMHVEQVPDNIPVGRWRLSVRIVGRSESGRMQIISRSSNFFTVLAP